MLCGFQTRLESSSLQGRGRFLKSMGMEVIGANSLREGRGDSVPRDWSRNCKDVKRCGQVRPREKGKPWSLLGDRASKKCKEKLERRLRG